MLYKSFGKKPAGKRLEEIKQSPNYSNNRFQNQSDTPSLAKGASFFDVLFYTLKKHPNRSPVKPIPVVKRDLNTVLHDKPVLTWFGHSSYLLQIEGKNILVDPVFSKRASFTQSIGPSAFNGTMQYGAADMPPIDVLILTHDHYDHMDYHTVLALKGKVKQVYTSAGVGAHLEYWGYDAAIIHELNWGHRITIAQGIELTATPARHFSGRGFIRNKTLWSSFVLRTAQYNIFIGGDSGYDTHFAEIGNTYGPFDLVILECGQYDGYWPYIHTTPEDTVQACIDLKGKVLLPVHWGKFSLSVHPWYEPITRATKKAAEMGVAVTTPMIGEALEIDGKYPTNRWWESVL